ncbi:pilin [Cupriavidus necator]|uniref:General secretion pathway protein H n=1 Tax=Cupriavidus pinatubonensis (strain JMP 134 / LMG 1197) TaxID=264198 RepID=Q475L8_CUPPJ|nr:prepilin-type N-terminal cleavage/methylation domain-containing protein [Cupriavidus necator]
MQRVQQIKKLGRRVQKGFTLIELMIVVAIIGILAAIAIPQYQDYVTRARWSDNITSIAPLKQAIAECVQNNAQAAIAAPCDDATAATGLVSTAGGGYTAGVPTPSSATVTYTGGVITLTGTAAAGNCVVTVTPVPSATAVTWTVANQAGGAVVCTKSKTGV